MSLKIENTIRGDSNNGDAVQPLALSGVDELFAALNTEMSCLNLLAFQYIDSTLTKAGAKLVDWQEGTTAEPVAIPYAEQRKNGERLAKFGLLSRACIRIGREGYPYEYTPRGVVGCALAGYNLDLANRYDVNLSELYGSKVRRITGRVDESSYNFSSPLFRTLLLIATKKFGDTNGEVRAQDYPALPGIEEVAMVDEIKVRHVEDLGANGFLSLVKRTELRSGMPTRSNHFSIAPDKVNFVDELIEVVRGISVIDDNWTDFIIQGLEKAKAVVSDPSTVAKLLSNREGQVQTTYEIDGARMRDIAIQLRDSGPFTTGDYRRKLGGKHDLSYLSNFLTGLVGQGLLIARPIDGSNRRQFS
jgi:hypothetical protein